MAWDIDSLKALLDERDKYWRELRDADQRALALALQRTDDHFSQLNENARRTIEERSHFVSVDAYEPFREQVIKQLTLQLGQTQGSDITIGKIYAAIGVVGAILGVIVLLANNVF